MYMSYSLEKHVIIRRILTLTRPWRQLLTIHSYFPSGSHRWVCAPDVDVGHATVVPRAVPRVRKRAAAIFKKLIAIYIM